MSSDRRDDRRIEFRGRDANSRGETCPLPYIESDVEMPHRGAAKRRTPMRLAACVYHRSHGRLCRAASVAGFMASLQVFAGACNDDDSGAPTRGEVVRSVALDIAMPSLDALAASGERVAAAGDPLCPPSRTGLAALQSAWRTMRGELKRAEPFAFGPAEQGFESALDFWPVRTEVVEMAVAETTAPTPEAIAALGVASKGLPELESLVFSPEGGDTAVLEALEDPQRCAYAQALAGDASRTATGLAEAWRPAGGGYVTQLAEAGPQSDPYPSVQRALDEIVNGSIFVLQDIVGPKLGTPLGAKSDGVPAPDEVESRFSDNARADMARNLAGVRAVYVGAERGLGLTDLVEPVDADLDETIRAQFDVAEAALLALDRPLRLMVGDAPARVEEARAAVAELLRLFEADVAGLLGVTVTLNDNDGD